MLLKSQMTCSSEEQTQKVDDLQTPKLVQKKEITLLGQDKGNLADIREKINQQLDIQYLKGLPVDQIDLAEINQFVGYSNKKCCITLEKAIFKV